MFYFDGFLLDYQIVGIFNLKIVPSTLALFR